VQVQAQWYKPLLWQADSRAVQSQNQQMPVCIFLAMCQMMQTNNWLLRTFKDRVNFFKEFKDEWEIFGGGKQQPGAAKSALDIWGIRYYVK